MKILEKRNFLPFLQPLNKEMEKKNRQGSLVWKLEPDSVYAVYCNMEDMGISIPTKILRELKNDEVAQWAPPVEFVDQFILIRKIGEKELVIFKYWFSSKRLDIIGVKIPQFIQS
jgi:hypothetical protein